MRKLMYALAGAAALASAQAASAAITIGTTGSTSGTTSATVTDNVLNPNKVEFDTTNALAGTVTSFFNFTLDSARTGVFSVTTATLPASSVTLLELLSGSTVLYSSAGSGTSLNLTTGTLAASTPYTFRYTANLSTAGNISGPANFYIAAVPEPATWGMMLLGFAGIGMTLRRRRRPALAQIA